VQEKRLEEKTGKDLGIVLMPRPRVSGAKEKERERKRKRESKRGRKHSPFLEVMARCLRSE